MVYLGKINFELIIMIVYNMLFYLLVNIWFIKWMFLWEKKFIFGGKRKLKKIYLIVMCEGYSDRSLVVVGEFLVF